MIINICWQYDIYYNLLTEFLNNLVVFYCPFWSEAKFCKLGILAQQYQIIAVGSELKNNFQTGRKRSFVGLCFPMFLPKGGG